MTRLDLIIESVSTLPPQCADRLFPGAGLHPHQPLNLSFLPVVDTLATGENPGSEVSDQFN